MCDKFTEKMETIFVITFAVLWFSNPLFAQISGARYVTGPKQRAFNSKDNLMVLLHQIHVPLVVPKGNVYFQLPTEYLTPRYQAIASQIAQKYAPDDSMEIIPVKAVNIPDLSIPLRLGRQEGFHTFIPRHQHMATKLIEIFMKAKSFEDFLSIAIYCRDRINAHMFVYALSIAILNRPDTKDVMLPSLAYIFPDKFVDGGILEAARQKAHIYSSGSKIRLEIPRDFTATDMDPEHRMAYFREDIGMNSNHWHWHLVYPSAGALSIVDKDRRGELFYYFHEQLVARYNFGRLCNGLSQVLPLSDFREPIREAYFPKLNNFLVSRVWPPRTAFTTLKDVHRPDQGLDFDIADLSRWRDRIYGAIDAGKIINVTGLPVELNETAGIDLLGDLVESSSLSLNAAYYGSLHNFGHAAIASCHDPDGRYLEGFGVMGVLSTSIRDPVFFRWHSFLNNLFQRHKKNLSPYTTQQLSFSGVKITGLKVVSENSTKNEFFTFWRKRDLDIVKGIDFLVGGPVNIRFTHLDHTPFVYRIQVENTGSAQLGMVRIFIAPTFDESGATMDLVDQRLLFVELDKFPVELRPGVNAFQRDSKDSSTTVPQEATYRDLYYRAKATSSTKYNYCACGWPEYMLVPKGTTEGFDAQLFVMISNYTEDKVDQPAPVGCKQAHSICGLNDRLYPDKRSMGFPFDRLPQTDVVSLDDFLTENMAVIDVKIRHIEKVVV